MVNEILRSGQNQLDMISELSERAKIVAGKLKLNIEKFDIHALLKDSISAVQLLSLKNDISLISEFDNNIVQIIEADRRRVGQVIANLLSNAIKYNKPGGSVWVSAQKRSNGSLRITVRDNGIGIKPEDLDSVFDAFERLNGQSDNVEGTGIGLSICSQLVQMMGGCIGVDSEFNLGTSFWVELPIAIK
jgi:signal transduction histidine kinase